MTWLEVVNKDLREHGTCKADTLDRIRLKQMICSGSAEGLWGSCWLEDDCLVLAQPGIYWDL